MSEEKKQEQEQVQAPEAKAEEKSGYTKIYVPENTLHTRHPKDDPSKSFDSVEIPLGRQKVESFTVAHRGDKEFDGKGDPNKDILLTVKSDRARNVTVYDRKTKERTTEQKMPEDIVKDVKAYKSYVKDRSKQREAQAEEISADVKAPEASAEAQPEA